MNSKEMAETYFARIGVGHKSAIKRPIDSRVDRRFRKLIEEANEHGDCIISGGGGYYRPDPSDPLDSLEYHVYIEQETSRLFAIDRKVSRMNEAFTERAGQ